MLAEWWANSFLRLVTKTPQKVWTWLLAWFDADSFKSNNGVSLGRRLSALVVVAITFCLVYVVLKTAQITAPWAATASTLVGFLHLVWFGSKFAKKPDPPKEGEDVLPK